MTATDPMLFLRDGKILSRADAGHVFEVMTGRYGRQNDAQVVRFSAFLRGGQARCSRPAGDTSHSGCMAIDLQVLNECTRKHRSREGDERLGGNATVESFACEAGEGGE